MLSNPAALGESNGARFATLLVLDRTARQLSDRLLDRYVDGDAQLRLFDRRPYMATMRLCRAMTAACDGLVQRIGDSSEPDALDQLCRAIASSLHFRRIDVLLRMFRYKRRNADQWKSIHRDYRMARDREIQARSIAVGRSRTQSTTVEREYIQLVLLDIADVGQLSPREALSTYHALGSLGESMSLRPQASERRGWMIDLNSAEGATRKQPTTSDEVLSLDTTPLLAALDRTRQTRLEAAIADETARARRPAEEALFAKLRVLFAPEPVRIVRRGDRIPASTKVRVVAGLGAVVQTLRADANTSTACATDGSTISSLVPATHLETSTAPTRGTYDAWQIRDESESGCRLRGKASDLNYFVPGSLVAIRAGESSSWTVILVRRLRRLMVDYLELGAEYMGRNPRYVKVMAPQATGPGDPTTIAGAKCFGAIYLPNSQGHPGLPIKTLVVPTRQFQFDDTLTLLSSSATYTLKLNEPIRTEADFVWTSFSVVDRINPASTGW